MVCGEKTFWKNPYLRQLVATVIDINSKDEVLFDRTIAFCLSGGQESDTGSFDGLPFIESLHDNDLNIRYKFAPGHGLTVGHKGIMSIDWERRNRLMRYHFSCELVLALINRHFGEIPQGQEIKPEQIDNLGIFKVMAKMSDTGAYVDFDHEDLSAVVPVLQSQIDAVIEADLPIEKGYLAEAEQRRYWRIPGLATIPCGGTHVRSTKELGKIVLKREKTTSKATASGKAQRIKIKLADESATDPGQLE